MTFGVPILTQPLTIYGVPLNARLVYLWFALMAYWTVAIIFRLCSFAFGSTRYSKQVKRYVPAVYDRTLLSLFGFSLIPEVFGCILGQHILRIFHQWKTSGQWLPSEWHVSIRQYFLSWIAAPCWSYLDCSTFKYYPISVRLNVLAYNSFCCC